jgi:omega-6 fatty acid desaturase (delta-12 desaturase)
MMMNSEVPADRAEKIPEDTGKWEPPGYTMKEIYDAIPPHCFRPNTLLSLGYVLRDFAFVATLALAATQIPSLPFPHLRHLAWFTYFLLQGLVFTGLWELAHECGHGALSKSKAFNHTAGLIIHSFLLVPFHSWRITHSQHHKSTNNLDRDIAFVPTLKEDFDKERATHSKAWELVEDTPLVALITLFFHQLIAWPIYIAINNFAIERMAAAPWWKRSHFYLGGDGPNFKPENTKKVLNSDIGIALAATGLWLAVRWFGAWNVMLFYGFPYLWTNHWIRMLLFFLARLDADEVQLQ